MAAGMGIRVQLVEQNRAVRKTELGRESGGLSKCSPLCQFVCLRVSLMCLQP